jgi:hypothetical protein
VQAICHVSRASGIRQSTLYNTIHRALRNLGLQGVGSIREQVLGALAIVFPLGGKPPVLFEAAPDVPVPSGE